MAKKVSDSQVAGIKAHAEAKNKETIDKVSMAIIMISSEMPELLGMSDRIMVMHEGEMMGELSKEEATQVRILELASGIKGRKEQ